MPITKLFLAIFGNNWRAILLSVVAATTFWFFNALNKNYSTRLNYPLDFSFSRDSVVVASPLPNRVLVDVSGGGWNLMRKTFLLSAGSILIQLDNPTEIKFLTRATLLPMLTEQLSGLTLDFVVTDTLFIDIQPKITKQVRIKVDSASVPLENGFRLVSPITISPDTVSIEGPKSMIDTLSDTYVMTFNENGIDYDYDDEIDIDYLTDLIASDPNEVTVTFDVDEFAQSLVSIPIEAANFPEDSSIYLADSTIDISYTSLERDLDKVRVSDFSVIADLTMLNERDSIILPILVAFPTYVMELELQPDSLKVVYAQ